MPRLESFLCPLGIADSVLSGLLIGVYLAWGKASSANFLRGQTSLSGNSFTRQQSAKLSRSHNSDFLSSRTSDTTAALWTSSLLEPTRGTTAGNTDVPGDNSTTKFRRSSLKVASSRNASPDGAGTEAVDVSWVKVILRRKNPLLLECGMVGWILRPVSVKRECHSANHTRVQG